MTWEKPVGDSLRDQLPTSEMGAWLLWQKAVLPHCLTFKMGGYKELVFKANLGEILGWVLPQDDRPQLSLPARMPSGRWGLKAQTIDLPERL